MAETKRSTAEKKVEDLHPKCGKVITRAIINHLFISLSCKLMLNSIILFVSNDM